MAWHVKQRLSTVARPSAARAIDSAALTAACRPANRAPSAGPSAASWEITRSQADGTTCEASLLVSAKWSK